MSRIYLIGEEERKRINIIKAIALIFVLFKHIFFSEINYAENTISYWNYIYQVFISNIVACFAVPTFFLLSAILFFSKERKYTDVVKSKVKTILVPYLIWNSFWVLIWIILQQIPSMKGFFSGHAELLKSDLVGWLKTYGIGTKFPLDYPLWFMRDLFIMFLIYPLIKIMVTKAPKISIVLGTILLFVPDYGCKTALSWFLIGGALVHLNVHLTFLDDISMLLVTLVFAACTLLTLVGVVRFSVPHLVTIYIMAEIVFVFRLSKTIYEKDRIRNIFIWLSKYMMIIYVFHELTLTSMKRVFLKLLPNTDLFVFCEYNLIPFIVVTICIVLGIVLQKISPKLYSISIGGRA